MESAVSGIVSVPGRAGGDEERIRVIVSELELPCASMNPENVKLSV